MCVFQKRAFTPQKLGVVSTIGGHKNRRIDEAKGRTDTLYVHRPQSDDAQITSMGYMKFSQSAVAVTLICSGCASVINDRTHPIKVETKMPSNEFVSGATCSLTNDYGTLVMKSGETALVKRSSQDLDIVCVHPDNPDAIARAISRVNGAMFGNILIGGGIGAIIDHSRGTAYTYPTWVQLEFGKTLAFDRNGESDGNPAPAVAPKLAEK